MTWPSARRTMYGGSLKPESWYSPTSSTPSARRGGGSEAAGAGGAEVGAEAAAGGVSVAIWSGREPDRRDRPRASESESAPSRTEGASPRGRVLRRLVGLRDVRRLLRVGE